MTLSQLQYFKTLARTLHYTRAAEELHIAQPSLSYAISELESELGVKLFSRVERRITLTACGEQFLPFVESALATLESGVSAVKGYADESLKRVRLGYFHSIAASMIPSLMDALYAGGSNRDLRFQFKEGTSREVFSALESGDLDLAFCMHRSEKAESIPVLRQPLYLAVPAAHPLAHKPHIGFEDFAAEPIVMLDRESNLRELTDGIFKRHGVTPDIMFVVRECNAALQYVSLGLCVSVLPMVPAMESDKIVVLPIEDPEGEFVRTVYFSWIKNRPLSPAVRRIRDEIRALYEGKVQESQKTSIQ
ncbi:MAG: LysR family transcriptional regulator [Lachnospiraceae bacterium]|nr:LysR family transcriptional regulator [Lachnospiraceae bacterium]